MTVEGRRRRIQCVWFSLAGVALGKGFADSVWAPDGSPCKGWRAFGYGIKTDDRLSVGLRRSHVPLVAMT